MLKVVVEIFPGGDPSRRRVVASMNVANKSDLADISSYSVVASEACNPLSGAPAWTAEATVTGHARSQSVWCLIAKAAAALKESDKVEM